MTLRDKIIFMLEQNRGEFISGQDMASSANVSRSAVAKCINNLKADGFLIKSVNNMGHCLESDCDVISEYGIRARLLNCNDVEIKTFKCIDSTNNEAKRLVAAGLFKDAIIVADEQTEGRGRRGRSFFSPDRSGLYFTAVLHPQVNLADSTGITAAAAVAVTKVLKNATKKSPGIKWVNDIFIEGRKVCGILTEAVADFESNEVQAVIVGIGINLTTEDFPEEISNIAASVGRINRCELASEIFTKLKEYCDKLPNRIFMDDYRKYSIVLGKSVTFNRNGKDYTATADNIFDDGSLEVTTSDGEKMVLNSGEISIKI